ncbi:MAG: hypothetical protein KL785_02485 [Brevundimonas sp.]|nr:hypothetical protein [Brevundimonas sp.]
MTPVRSARHLSETPGPYRELQPLRLPSGWRVGLNELYVGMDADLGEVGGSSVFNATNEGRRFNIDIEFRPEFDPEGAFHLTVLYQPWPRTERGAPATRCAVRLRHRGADGSHL